MKSLVLGIVDIPQNGIFYFSPRIEIGWHERVRNDVLQHRKLYTNDDMVWLTPDYSPVYFVEFQSTLIGQKLIVYGKKFSQTPSDWVIFVLNTGTGGTLYVPENKEQNILVLDTIKDNKIILLVRKEMRFVLVPDKKTPLLNGNYYYVATKKGFAGLMVSNTKVRNVFNTIKWQEMRGYDITSYPYRYDIRTSRKVSMIELLYRGGSIMVEIPADVAAQIIKEMGVAHMVLGYSMTLSKTVKELLKQHVPDLPQHITEIQVRLSGDIANILQAMEDLK